MFFWGSGHVEGLSSQQACPCPTFTASPEPGVLRCGAPDFIHMPTWTKDTSWLVNLLGIVLPGLLGLLQPKLLKKFKKRWQEKSQLQKPHDVAPSTISQHIWQGIEIQKAWESYHNELSRDGCACHVMHTFQSSACTLANLGLQNSWWPFKTGSLAGDKEGGTSSSNYRFSRIKTIVQPFHMFICLTLFNRCNIQEPGRTHDNLMWFSSKDGSFLKPSEQPNVALWGSIGSEWSKDHPANLRP